mmetsp:Transcript_13059/g.27407  ORF Transcript_13059/g.27407 Transcript_13059/m.27407 type:complete len:111 (+) Transcript_13059:378-710(+)
MVPAHSGGSDIIESNTIEYNRSACDDPRGGAPVALLYRTAPHPSGKSLLGDVSSRLGFGTPLPHSYRSYDTHFSLVVSQGAQITKALRTCLPTTYQKLVVVWPSLRTSVE